MATAQVKIKNHFSPSERVVSPNGGKDRKPAKQEFKDDADINSIMKKFQKSGAIDHAKIHQGSYGDTTGQTLHDAMNIVTNAETMFASLPSSVRNKFKNSAAKFLDYVQDAENAEEAANLGISLAPEAAKAASEAAEAAEKTKAVAPPQDEAVTATEQPTP